MSTIPQADHPPHTQGPGPQLPVPLRPLALVEEALTWLFTHPLLNFQILIFWLIAWGMLGADMGLDDLFWHQSVVRQFVVGISVGLLFEQIFFIRYLLAQERKRSRFPLTFYPVKEPSIRDLGRSLMLSWPAALIALAAPKFLTLQGQSAEPFLPLVLGLAVSVFGSTLLVMLGEYLGIRARIQRSLLFRLTPGIAWGYLPKADHPLHALALFLGILFLLGVVAAEVLHAVGHILVTPYLVLCLLFAVINGVYGFFASQLRGLQHLVFLALIVAGVLLNSNTFDPDHDYRMSFPHMEPYYSAVREAVSQAEVPPASADFLRLDEEYTGQGRERIEYYRNRILSPEHSAAAAGLIPSEKPLQAMAERWQAKHPGTKPRIVIVCTSGGGIRAAVWTAVVLEGLEEKINGFRDHIRLVAGASGGMVGAGLYVADFENPTSRQDIDPRTGLGTYSRMLARESLAPAVQTMLLTDLPRVWIPRPNDHDRGRALEEAWYRNTRRKGEDRSPFEKSFADLRPLELQGLRPSLLYTPMLVEDSRRLLISNLDLDVVTNSWSQQLASSDFAEGGKTEVNNDPTKPELSNLRTQRSLSAVEFFRLFPKATGFRVSTAARMNASFPLVSPAVNLPTYPPRRVVDAGYYDNYGINVTCLWLLANKEMLKKHTSGVMIVEIRSSRNGYLRRHFQDQEKLKRGSKITEITEDASKDLVSQSIEGLATPAEAVITAQDRASLYRNDELIDLVDKTLNPPEDRDFFTTVAFECKKKAALSWSLDRQDEINISSNFWEDTEHKAVARDTQRRLDEMVRWFGKGGK